MTGQARLIAVDWGTSSLRAYLLGDGGAIIDERAMPWGIMATPGGDFAKALETVTEDWRRRQIDLPMIASGMIGSAQGWREIPYVRCPAGLEDLVAALKLQTNVLLPIVPGLVMDGDIPDVIRGEETQIIGALDRMPQLHPASLLVLPGTHSKWVSVKDGKIVAFTTYLTGELFAVLGKHSILGRPALTAGASTPPKSETWEAFDRGVLTIRENASRSLSSLLFSARTMVLSHRLPAELSLDYLSGLLLGEELRSALGERRRREALPLALIGETTLCERYLRALKLFDVTEVAVIAEAATTGLWRIAERTLSQLARP
jgi:2-dehydro-3-deoxygalactonokinase